jgi:peptidoglycan/LPS O-acetylase OafA/YrhL
MADTETAKGTSERFGWADGLRGLAALAILAYEILRHAPRLHWASPLAERAALATAHGFDALLVLSGLLLAFPVLSELRRTGRGDLNLARYAAGRALRILPSYYLVLAATLLIPLGAAAYGIGGLNHTAPALRETGLQALFAGDGLGNDGFRALAVEVRLLALFPLLLAVYAFAPAILAALAGLALYLDFATPAHHWGTGAAPALMLGIVAADVIARGLRVERIAWLLIPLAAAGAFSLDPILAGLPGPVADPSFLVWNPLWALAAAALAVACSRRPHVARVLGSFALRPVAGLSFALVLVADPVATFVLAHAAQSGWTYLSAAGVCLGAALGLWLIVDRAAIAPHAGQALRQAVTAPFGEVALMAFGAPRPARRVETAAAQAKQVDERFGPLPTMHPGMLATVVHRVGSLEDLGAEIEAAKRCLAEAGTGVAFFEPAEFVTVPEQLVLAHSAANAEPQLPVEGVLLPPVEPSTRKVVTLAVGANRPARPTVRVRFGPGRGDARAS